MIIDYHLAILLSERVYQLLKREKRAGESFSEVIERIIKKKESLVDNGA